MDAVGALAEVAGEAQGLGGVDVSWPQGLLRFQPDEAAELVTFLRTIQEIVKEAE